MHSNKKNDLIIQKKIEISCIQKFIGKKFVKCFKTQNAKKTVNRKKSNCIDLHQGVTSGTVPWPLLFHLYVIKIELI